MRDRQHGSTCERVAVDRGDRDAGEVEDAAEQPVHVGQHRCGRVGVRGHPVEVQAVRVELAFARGDESKRAFHRGEIVERAMPLGHRSGVESVLAVTEVDHHHVATTLDVQHAVHPRGGRWPLETRPA